MKILHLQVNFIAFVVFLGSLVGGSKKVFDIKNTWDTGFQGEINIDIQEDTEKGWKLEVRFHKRVGNFECLSGKLRTFEHGAFGSKFVYTNFAFNKVLKSGQTFQVEFNGLFYGDPGQKVPPVTIRFQHRIIYSDPYDLVNGMATSSTTDSVYVNSSLIDGTPRSTIVTDPRDDNSHPIGNEVTVSPTEVTETNEELGNHDINDINQGNVKTEEEINREENNHNKRDKTKPTKNPVHDITPEEDYGSGIDDVITTQSPTKLRARPTRYPYAKVIHKSLLFYEAQRSGRLPKDNRIPWRGDSAMNDTGNRGEDLTGGYYDAGDHIKFGFPLAFSMTTLAWGVIEYWEGYKQAGELENVLKALKWGVDYILKSYVGKYELYGQVGVGKLDHEFWGRPEDMNMKRPAFSITAKKPGSDLAAESSAALSACSLAFERSAMVPYASRRYVNLLREKAQSLLEFANKYRGKYHKAIKDAGNYYPSGSYRDELVWGAAWLYRATGKKEFLDNAEGKYYNWALFGLPYQLFFSWDDKTIGAQVLLSQITGGEKRKVYLERVSDFCTSLRNDKGRFTRKGLMFMDKWSSLRYAANVAFICLLAADQGVNSTANVDFSRKQIHYMLGDAGMSYVVGFGKNYPLFIHHRGSSCASPGCGCEALRSQEPNPHILEGALVGGPNETDEYNDIRQNYVGGEVALDHNSCFQGAVAALLQKSLIGIPASNFRSQEPWFANYLNSTTTKQTPTTTSGSPFSSYYGSLLSLSVVSFIYLFSS